MPVEERIRWHVGEAEIVSYKFIWKYEQVWILSNWCSQLGLVKSLIHSLVSSWGIYGKTCTFGATTCTCMHGLCWKLIWWLSDMLIIGMYILGGSSHMCVAGWRNTYNKCNLILSLIIKEEGYAKWLPLLQVEGSKSDHIYPKDTNRSHHFQPAYNVILSCLWW